MQYHFGETHLVGMSSASSIRLATGPPTHFFDYENDDDEDENEKQSAMHFRQLPPESLFSNVIY